MTELDISVGHGGKRWDINVGHGKKLDINVG